MTALVQLPTLFPQRKPPPRPKLRPLDWPRAAELAYAQELLGVARRAQEGIRKHAPRISKLVAKSKAPRADDIADDLQRLMQVLRNTFEIPTREARAIANRMLSMVDFSQMRGMADAYADLLTLNPMLGQEKWLPEAMEIATAENVALIKSIPSTMFDRVQKMVGDAVMMGLRPEQLAVAIYDEFGVSENRALLIAQDQLGKWFGSLQRSRQLDAGILQFEWAASSDERVRESHRRREGKVYAWANPPDGEIPGQAIRCRCVAVPVVPDWDAEESGPAGVIDGRGILHYPAGEDAGSGAKAQAALAWTSKASLADDASTWAHGIARALEGKRLGEALPGMQSEVAALQQSVGKTLGLEPRMSFSEIRRIGTSEEEEIALASIDPRTRVLSISSRMAEQPEQAKRVMVHEVIHTLGGAFDQRAYRGPARVIEEAVTEELADALFTSGEMELTRKPASAVKLTMAAFEEVEPEWRRSAQRGIWIEHRPVYGEITGGYKKYRQAMYSSIGAVTGEYDPLFVRARLREAGLAWKRQAYESAEEATEAFIRALGRDEGERAVYREIFSNSTLME